MKHPIYAVIGFFHGHILIFAGIFIWQSATSACADLDAMRVRMPAAVINEAQASVVGDGYGLALIIVGSFMIIGGLWATFFIKHPTDDVMRELNAIALRIN